MSLSVANTFINNPAIWAKEFNRGAKTAFHHLFSAFYPELVYYIKNIVDNLEVAEELADDTFLKAWKLPDKHFLDEDEAKAWLVTVGHRAALDHIKVKGRGDARFRKYLIDQKPEETEDFSKILENQVIKATLLKEVLTALDQLGEQQRTVIRLTLEGLDTAEIAAIMSLPSQTVRNYRSKAIRNLQKHLSNLAFIFLLLFVSRNGN